MPVRGNLLVGKQKAARELRISKKIPHFVHKSSLSLCG
jgi:hypothetical protein